MAFYTYGSITREKSEPTYKQVNKNRLIMRITLILSNY